MAEKTSPMASRADLQRLFIRRPGRARTSTTDHESELDMTTAHFTDQDPLQTFEQWISADSTPPAPLPPATLARRAVIAIAAVAATGVAFGLTVAMLALLNSNTSWNVWEHSINAAELIAIVGAGLVGELLLVWGVDTALVKLVLWARGI